MGEQHLEELVGALLETDDVRSALQDHVRYRLVPN